MHFCPKLIHNSDGKSTKKNNVTPNPNTYIFVPHGGCTNEKNNPFFCEKKIT